MGRPDDHEGVHSFMIELMSALTTSTKQTNHHLLMKWIQRLFGFTDMAVKYDEYQIITNCRC